MNNANLDKIDSLVKDIRALQRYLDWRTEEEQYAIELMECMEYENALRVMQRLDRASLEDFYD